MKLLQKTQGFLSHAREGFRNYCAKAAVAGGATLAPVLAHAQLNTSGIESAIEAAKDSGLTVGGYVIAAVAGLVVVGIIIAVIRKI